MQANVSFEVYFSSASPKRYDTGLFIALDGGSAITGYNTCYHDYLAAPLTTSPTYVAYYPPGDPALDDVINGPWWNGEPSDTGDLCGEVAPNTAAIMQSTDPIWISCVDTNGDGRVDVNVCGSYDNNSGNTCVNESGAYPGTPSKCGCMTVNLDFTPTAVEALNFTGKSENTPVGLYLVLFLLLLTGIALSVYARFRMRTHKPTG
jgi:hypothetical protein